MTGRGLLHQLHPRHIRWWQWLVLVFLGVVFIVRVWLPEFLRQQIIVKLASVTSARVQLGDVDIDLFRGHAALQQIAFTLDGDSQPIVAIDDLAVKVSLRALLRREVDLEDVRLSGVKVVAIQDASGQFNLNRLFPASPLEQKQPPSDLPALTVRRLAIVDSRIIYSDVIRTPAAPVTLAVTALTTTNVALQPNGLVVPILAQINGTVEKSPFKGETQLLWQRQQTDIDAHVEVQPVALAVAEPYLHDLLTVQKLSGQLGAKLHYRYQSRNQPTVHSLDGVARLERVRFVDPVQTTSVTEIPDGSVEIHSIDFLKQQVEISTVTLQEPRLSLLQTPAGLNVASWVRTSEIAPGDKKQPENNSPPTWNVILRAIKWTGGEIIYRDSTWPEKELLTLQPEEIVVEKLGSEMRDLPFQFRTRVGDGKLTGEGRVQFSPFGLQLSLQPAELETATLQALLTPVLAAKKLRGKVTGKLYTDISEQNGTQNIHIHGVIETKKFTLDNTPEQGNEVGWEQGKIEIDEGSTFVPFSLRLKPDLLNVTLKRPERGDLVIEKATGEVRLAQVTAPDGQQQIAITGSLDTMKLSMNGLPETTNVLAWDTGHLEFREGSTLTPFLLNLKTQITQLSLPQLPQGDVTVEKANGDLRLTQEMSEQQTPVLKVYGPVEFTSFSLTHGDEKQILLGCYHGKGTVSEGSRLVPLDIKLHDVALEYAYAQGMRPPAGQFQLFIPPINKQDVKSSASLEIQPESVSPPGAAETVPTVQPTEPLPSVTSGETFASSPSIQIDRATIIGGQLYFEDRTVTPPQTVYWQDVHVDLSRAGYPVLLPSAFSAHAYNEDGAPVEFKGTTERKGELTVVRVHGKVEKMSLPRFNSYLEPSLGYRVKKGAVSATWDLVLPGDRVQAKMKVTLHDINLSGKQKASMLEQQVGLPLALVIALLKDLNGDIDLQLPMEGRVNDPGFEWSGTVVRAIRDVLIGAVTSPLKVLGALFKGKDKLEGFTFEPIRFTPGSSQIAENSKEQLSHLALFLTQRPNLDLRFSGVIGPDDLEFLRDQLILNQVPAKPAPSEKESEAAPQVSPQDEVHQFLAKKLSSLENETIPPLSAQATELLTQLRKRAKVPADEVGRLAGDRVQVVIAELTTRHAIAADRLHISPEKQRGAGSTEVRYTIQTREE